MFAQPVAAAFREGVVVERGLQVTHRARNLQHLVDRARVSGALRPHQPDVPGRDLRMPQPGVAKVVAPTQPISGHGWIVPRGYLDDLLRQLPGAALIRIQQQHPGMTEAQLVQGSVAVRGVIVKDPLRHMRAQAFGNGDGRVRTERVKDIHVI